MTVLVALMWVHDPATCSAIVQDIGVEAYLDEYQCRLDEAMELRGMPYADVRIGGDFNGDRKLDLDDYRELQILWGRCPPDPTQARWDHPTDYVKFWRNAACFGLN